jgi:hypothetical protein
MKHRLRLVILIFSFVCIHSEIIAQQQIEVKSEADFKNAFVSEVVKHNDTICKYVKKSGIMFFRFLLNNEGVVDSIKCSEKQPMKLIHVLTETLGTVKFPSIGTDDGRKYYVLPILYDYQPEFKIPNTVEELKDQMPIIDMENLNSYLNFDFNGFFKTEESEKKLWGINCVVLPMVKVGILRVYYHKNQKLQNEEKTKDKKMLQFK